MKWFSLIIIIVAVALLQTTVFAFLPIFGATPDLFLILLVFVSLYARRSDAIIAGWGIGLAKDLAILGPIGPFSVIFMAAAFILGSVREAIFRDHPLTQLLGGFMVSLACGVAYVAFNAVMGIHPALWHQARQVLLRAVLTGILTPPLIFLLSKMRRWFGLKRVIYFR